MDLNNWKDTEGIDSPFNACMYREGCRHSKAEIERLRAENAELRKDAERYRFIRSFCEDDFGIVRGVNDDDSTYKGRLVGIEVDEWADAAMKGE